MVKLEKPYDDMVSIINGAVSGVRADLLAEMALIARMTEGRKGLQLVKKLVHERTLSSLQRVEKILDLGDPKGLERRTKLAMAFMKNDLGRDPTTEEIATGSRWVDRLADFVSKAAEGFKIPKLAHDMVQGVEAKCPGDVLSLMGYNLDGTFQDHGRQRFVGVCALYALFSTPLDQWPQDFLASAKANLEALAQKMVNLAEALQPVDVSLETEDAGLRKSA